MSPARAVQPGTICSKLRIACWWLPGHEDDNVHQSLKEIAWPEAADFEDSCKHAAAVSIATAAQLTKM